MSMVKPSQGELHLTTERLFADDHESTIVSIAVETAWRPPNPPFTVRSGASRT
jgi:hypothetical protein